MSSPTAVPRGAAQVDLISTAVLACPAVVALHPGGLAPVATYLPGRRVVGVQIGDDIVRVAVVGVLGVPVADLDSQVRHAVAPYTLGRGVHVHVADVQAAAVVAPPALEAAPVLAAPPVVPAPPAAGSPPRGRATRRP